MSPNLGNLRRLEIRPYIFSGGVLADYFRVMSPNLGNLLRRFEIRPNIFSGGVLVLADRRPSRRSTSSQRMVDVDGGGDQRGPANPPPGRRVSGGQRGTGAGKRTTRAPNRRRRRHRGDADEWRKPPKSPTATDGRRQREADGRDSEHPHPPTHTLRMAWQRPGRDCNHLVEKLAPPPPQEMGFGAPMSP